MAQVRKKHQRGGRGAELETFKQIVITLLDDKPLKVSEISECESFKKYRKEKHPELIHEKKSAANIYRLMNMHHGKYNLPSKNIKDQTFYINKGYKQLISLWQLFGSELDSYVDKKYFEDAVWIACSELFGRYYRLGWDLETDLFDYLYWEKDDREERIREEFKKIKEMAKEEKEINVDREVEIRLGLSSNYSSQYKFQVINFICTLEDDKAFVWMDGKNKAAYILFQLSELKDLI